ncbi:MAG TPA: hypothetical protein VOB72_08295, partial [Candidatus Dormibacteraeota bacterium]|nr:hypothetical protein [Candidatus Dormibacteraeota bacterium]
SGAITALRYDASIVFRMAHGLLYIHLAPAGEPVFVQVSPGNAASLRVVLAAGYRPIGSEVLLPRR